MSTKSYSELITLKTFEERFNYLKLGGSVGKETFGSDRYLNQTLYGSAEWKRVRRKVIIRDNSCDLGCDGFEIHDRVYIHHLNAISIDDILRRDPKIFDLDNLISVSFDTHQALHYGDIDLLTIRPNERSKNDTCPWRHD